MSELELLKRLADGSYHSGEELGVSLGISRTAVWKQISKLSERGIVVESAKSKGYRVPGGLDLLSEQQVFRQLSAESAGQLSALVIEFSTPSTNQLARARAEAGNSTGFAVIAEQQTAGQGRRGRTWISPFGRNLYLSLVWGFDSGVEAVEGLSLAVGVAVCRAAERVDVDDLQLKWPNDLLWQGRKVGGILLEVIGDPAGFCQVIIGVGLNVGMSADQAAAVDQPWADLGQAAGGRISRSELAGCVLDELLRLLTGYERSGFAAYREEWTSRDAFADQSVRLLMVTKEVAGVARGVSDRGALCLEVDGELREYSGGEISMRRQR